MKDFNLDNEINQPMYDDLIITGMTKLLVGLGNTEQKNTDNVEIIDLSSTSTSCKNPPNFPLKLYRAFGFQEKSMICGGNDDVEYNSSDKCFSLENDQWISSPSLNTARAFSAVAPSPYPSKSQKFFVTGGSKNLDYSLDTAEVLTEQGWQTLATLLPDEITPHCSVLVNLTTVLLIGGRHNYSRSPNTFFFNTERETWTQGPPLESERIHHSCGRIRKNSQSRELSIIVAGGYDGSVKVPNGWDGPTLSSVQILDEGATEWRKGPELPIKIEDAQLVEDEDGGVILVGGKSDFIDFLDTLYYLPHAGEDAEWTEMKQKMKVGRKGHVAFLLNENLVDCS